MGHLKPTSKTRACFAFLTKVTCISHYSQTLEQLHKKTEKRKQLNCHNDMLITPQCHSAKGSNVPNENHVIKTDEVIDQISQQLQSKADDNAGHYQIERCKGSKNSPNIIREWEEEWKIYAITLDHLLFWTLLLINIINSLTFLAFLPQASKKTTT